VFTKSYLHSRWNTDSSVALSSWGPGRADLFINTTNASSGYIELTHTWADGGGWSGTWEVLGTGLMHGSPAAVSWGSSRIDVFVGGGGSGLAHKSYNGRWSGWEDLGGVLTSSPAVTSWGSGRLDVFGRGTDAQLWHIWFDGGWSSWEGLGGYVSGTPDSWGDTHSIAVTSNRYNTIDVTVIGADDVSAYQKSWNPGWTNYGYIGAVSRDIAMASWYP
jgi:hypothetical protein